uniref:cytochrome c oxidase subunit III n=1 Tax=Trimma macrophthalmum TaxID=1478008 RepID=UPI00286CC2CD|nr:cytochrome c oxidase subunit III [Trimma macrophthalmum]WKD79686.1 cytochrome c oxidase subunit III [Trimma macrophthalmum]
MSFQTHAYHMVTTSPWPLTGAIAALLMTSGLAIWFHHTSMILIYGGTTILLLTMYQWWRDIVREGTFQGHHTPPIQSGLRYGMILFITSEVFFFLGFFWAFFHSSLAPTPEIGAQWPPTGITPLDPFAVPLLNTAVLLSSGITVTWAHHSIMEGERKQAIQSLAFTILLGGYFTVLQALEYIEAPFTTADSAYGATFFVATGFHGLHVIIGTTFLAVCFLRQINFHFTMKHHFGFEAAAWYWHFVDVVWLMLYVSIYWWGSAT